MTLTYQATLEDVSEAAIRHFLRSKTAKLAKIRSTISGAVCCALAGVFIFRRGDMAPLLIAGLAGGLFGAALNFFSYEPTVRGRIRKHMQRETEGRRPATTVYTVGKGSLVCESLGAIITFPLSSLENVSVDHERLEISFGLAGLCTIPLRAFGSTPEREQFIGMLNAEHTTAPEPSVVPGLESESSIRGSEG